MLDPMTRDKSYITKFCSLEAGLRNVAATRLPQANQKRKIEASTTNYARADEIQAL